MRGCVGARHVVPSPCRCSGASSDPCSCRRLAFVAAFCRCLAFVAAFCRCLAFVAAGLQPGSFLSSQQRIPDPHNRPYIFATHPVIPSAARNLLCPSCVVPAPSVLGRSHSALRLFTGSFLSSQQRIPDPHNRPYVFATHPVIPSAARNLLCFYWVATEHEFQRGITSVCAPAAFSWGRIFFHEAQA